MPKSTPSDLSGPPAKRPRAAISDAQKQALRVYFNQSHPHPTQKACVEWFFSQFSQQIDRTTVSKILSPQYAHLDTGPAGSNTRVSTPYWPILDQRLADWVEERSNAGYSITGPLIQAKAAELWKKIPEYCKLPKPQFSEGWLARFKNRHTFSYHTFHGEAASVPPSIHEDIRPIRSICDQFQPEDIYNMDETGLYWRRMPNGGLSKGKIAGQTKDKTRISIAIATNATGSDRMPLWIIGRSKTPRALRGVNFHALGCVWRWNDKAWMRHGIMEEWLRSFYGRISMGRRVLLLLDNCSAHTVAVAKAPPPPRIQILFFPANATSVYQPLDQGIIQNLKHYYRKKWMYWMIAILDRGLDPHEKMSLNYTLHWLVDTWRRRISDQTIQNCFFKSTLIRRPSESLIESPIEINDEIKALYAKAVEKLGDSDEIISMEEFFDPLDENLSPDLIEDRDDKGGNRGGEHTEIYISTEGAQIDEEAGPPPEILSNSEMAESLQNMLLFFGNKKDSTSDDIRNIHRIMQSFSRIQIGERQQTTMDSWLVRQ